MVQSRPPKRVALTKIQKLTKARKEEPWDPKTRIIQQMEKKQLQRTENCESFKQLPDTLTFHHE